jgi:predicted O-methyltransferase YrrM
MTERFDDTLARQVDAYIERLFLAPDETLARVISESAARGLPSISVSPNEGKLLHLLARLAGARRILEIGTLGGYSTAWLARALPADGRLVTLEVDERHAEVARQNLARCGVADRVEVRVGPAVDSLRAMIAGGDAPFDIVFIDADKESYPDYLEASLQLTRPGSLILADNVIRGGTVTDPPDGDPQAVAISRFNQAIATHPGLDSLILPVIRDRFDGLSLSIVR